VVPRIAQVPREITSWNGHTSTECYREMGEISADSSSLVICILGGPAFEAAVTNFNCMFNFKVDAGNLAGFQGTPIYPVRFFFTKRHGPKNTGFKRPLSFFSTKKVATIINAITAQDLTMYAIGLSSIRVREAHAY
jgi:hypothetical protein